METKLHWKNIRRVKEKIGFVFGLMVPKSEKCSGLAMLWKKEVKLEIMGYAGNFIDAIVIDETLNFKWRITGFYGCSEVQKRKESWDQLKALNRRFQLPWLCFGDFNEILSMDEKMGGACRSQRQMEGFRSAVNACCFKDLGFFGPKFTWCNMQEGDDRVYLRLDRAFATQSWADNYKEARVHHIVDSTSDHFALLISDSTVYQLPRRRRFHFEAMWTKKEECMNIAEAAWRSSTNQINPRGMAERLNQCAIELNRWNRSTFGRVPKQI